MANFGPLQNPNPRTDRQKNVTVDYVHETTRYANFGANLSTGAFWANGWNITLNYFYIRTYIRTYVRIPFFRGTLRTYIRIPFFRGTTHRSDPSTDFDAWWLKRREFTQGCAFWGLQKLKVTFNPFLGPPNVDCWRKNGLKSVFRVFLDNR